MRIIAIRADRLGDAIVATPALQLLKNALPASTGAHITYCTANAYVNLFEGLPCADTVISAETALATPHFFKGFNAAVFFNPHPALQRAAAAAGVPRRVGYALPAPSLANPLHYMQRCMPGFPAHKAAAQTNATLTHALPYTQHQGTQHEAAYCADVLKPLLAGNLKNTLHFSTLPAPQVQRQAPAKPLGFRTNTAAGKVESGAAAPPRIAFALGASAGKPRLPFAYFAAAAEAMLTNAASASTPPPAFLLMGTAEESALAQRFISAYPALKPHLRNVCGQYPLPELAHILSTCAGCLARDTGLAHLAAAAGCPTATVFLTPHAKMGPTRWAPLGGNARTRVRCVSAPHSWQRPWESSHAFTKRHLKRMPPQQVAQACVKAFLESA